MVLDNLYFFDKNGDSLNLQIDSETGAWEGSIFFEQLSIALYDNENIFILEKIGSDYKFPALSPGQYIEIEWDSSLPSPFFLYDVTKELDIREYVINKVDKVKIDYDDILPTSDGSNIDLNLPLQVNIAFNPELETEYERTLNIYLRDSLSPSEKVLLSKIKFYGEGEDEDERFRVWLQNFGIVFNRQDANILASYNIKEAFPNWKKINESRKNILVNQSEIFPYIGTYKGLVNFVNMLGYKDHLHIQEYWKNVNKDSQYYNKLFLVDLTDILDDGKIDNLNLLNKNVNLKSTITHYYNKNTNRYESINYGCIELIKINDNLKLCEKDELYQYIADNPI